MTPTHVSPPVDERAALHPAPNVVSKSAIEELPSGQGSEIRPATRAAITVHPRRHCGATTSRVAPRWRRAKMGVPRPTVTVERQRGGTPALRLPSTEMRRVPIDCRATVGEVGNSQERLIKIGKKNRGGGRAFRSRRTASPWLKSIRTVVALNSRWPPPGCRPPPPGGGTPQTERSIIES